MPPSRHRRVTAVPAVFVSVMIAAGLAACERSAPAPTRFLKAGAPACLFDPKNVAELVIVKNDPATGDSWSARVSRRGDSPDGENWEIASAPDGRNLIDRRADGRFIAHLIDTLRTLHPTEAPSPEGPLTSFGLAPPQFSLRWSAGGAAFDLRLGSPVPKGEGRYGYVAAGTPAYGTGEAAGDSPVYVLDGAAIQMLSLLTGFDILRHRQLSTVSTDEVDEVEFWQGSRLSVYAQREGDGWTDRRHRKLGAPIGAWLDGLTHARVRQFIDDAGVTAQLLPPLRERPEFKAVFKDRHGQATQLAVVRDGDGKVLSSISTRPDAVFELYPEAFRLFQPPPAR